jgi:uncharacterized membrane-anchored protein
MWVSADDRALWQELIGEKTPLSTAPAEDEDDVITFAEREIDRTCRAGEEGWFISDGRPQSYIRQAVRTPGLLDTVIAEIDDLLTGLNA